LLLSKYDTVSDHQPALRLLDRAIRLCCQTHKCPAVWDAVVSSAAFDLVPSVNPPPLLSIPLTFQLPLRRHGNVVPFAPQRVLSAYREYVATGRVHDALTAVAAMNHLELVEGVEMCHTSADLRKAHLRQWLRAWLGTTITASLMSQWHNIRKHPMLACLLVLIECVNNMPSLPTPRKDYTVALLRATVSEAFIHRLGDMFMCVAHATVITAYLVHQAPAKFAFVLPTIVSMPIARHSPPSAVRLLSNDGTPNSVAANRTFSVVRQQHHPRTFSAVNEHLATAFTPEEIWKSHNREEPPVTYATLFDDTS